MFQTSFGYWTYRDNFGRLLTLLSTAPYQAMIVESPPVVVQDRGLPYRIEIGIPAGPKDQIQASIRFTIETVTLQYSESSATGSIQERAVAGKVW